MVKFVHDIHIKVDTIRVHQFYRTRMGKHFANRCHIYLKFYIPTETESGAHPTLHPMGTDCSFPEAKATGT
jgi:hypothetical protein